MSTELKVFFEIFFNTINEINENTRNIPLRNSALAITRNLYFDILMEITNELRNNQETINESNNFQNNIINGFQTAQNSFSMTPFLTNSINMITGFSTKSKEIISDYLDIILLDSFKKLDYIKNKYIWRKNYSYYLDEIFLTDSFEKKYHNNNILTRLYFRKIQLEIFLRWKKSTNNDFDEDIIEFNNLVSKYQVNYSNYVDLCQINSILYNKDNNILLDIIPFYESKLMNYLCYDQQINKLNSKNCIKDNNKLKEILIDEIKEEYEKLLREYLIYYKAKKKLNSKNSNKDESNKDESKKDESNKDESKKDESKKDESKKDESKTDKSKKDDKEKKEKKVKKTKEKIPASVKSTLWSQHFPNIIEGKCKCCQTEVISRNNFDCGHIISEKEGGKIHLDNLKPICRLCNSSMGTQNMTDYMKKYGFDKISK